MRSPAGRAPVVTIAVALVSLAGCSGSDTASSVERDTTAPGSTSVSTVPAADDRSGEPAGSTDVTDAPTDDATIAPSSAPATTFAVVDVPETGVPGLDSDDSFCAAWSRFGGSWQVIQVAANFAPDPTVVPSLEVAASPVVTAAFDAMFASWPAELDDERDVVADGFFGPLERRAEVAVDALVAAGADADQLAAIGDAWEAALAQRQPDEPVVTPSLSDDLQALVDVAAADLDGRLVGFVADPSMRITAETPSTDAYLATACPDQGALTGAEIDG